MQRPSTDETVKEASFPEEAHAAQQVRLEQHGLSSGKSSGN